MESAITCDGSDFLHLLTEGNVISPIPVFCFTQKFFAVAEKAFWLAAIQSMSLSEFARHDREVASRNLLKQVGLPLGNVSLYCVSLHDDIISLKTQFLKRSFKDTTLPMALKSENRSVSPDTFKCSVKQPHPKSKGNTHVRRN